MKTLALLRHGKSSRDDPALGDFDRPLNARGHQASLRMGQELARLGVSFELVLASPALRTCETLRFLQEGYGAPLPSRVEESLYLATSEGILGIVRATADTVRTLLIVGHNPGLQELALALDAREESKRAFDHYPTAALALFEIRCESWAEARPAAATLQLYRKPRDLT